MSIPRSHHSASLLPDGNVLVVGGFYAVEYPTFIYLKSCEIFNPVSGIWSLTDSLHEPFSGHTAVTLQDSSILVVGGHSAGASCELFSPTTMSWSYTGSLNLSKQQGYTATLLPNAKVLVAGAGDQGLSTTCELYDPALGIWALTDSLPYDISNNSAILLNNGKVLLSGGFSYAAGHYISNCFLFDYNIATKVNEIRNLLPQRATLNNYPNPFNPSTVLRFTIPCQNHVSLMVYDCNGQHVATLFNGNKYAGTYDVTFDGHNLSSGVYFCRLTVGKQILSSKIILSK
jgi:hypothetical protein